MVAKIHSATLLGLHARIIEVEVDFRFGLSSFTIVGLGDKAIQEAKERIISAVKNTLEGFNQRKIVVNLAPADLPKSGPAFDLAIAVGLLLATAEIDIDPRKTLFLGELALNGSLRPIHGVLPLVAGAKQQGFEKVFLPAVNAKEASLVRDIEIAPLDSLEQLYHHFVNGVPLPAIERPVEKEEPTYKYDLAHVKGQLQARRALEIAAAGGHNLLLSGVPGSGKTLLMKCLPTILPKLEFQQSLEVSKVHSVAGMLSEDAPLLSLPPFRHPHHSVSTVALVGGGAHPRPGEISLAHKGVLFLDEFTEFSLAAIEALRQPLEDAEVVISRAAYTVTYPAEFMLVAAMNPCKCGHYGDPDIACTCSPNEIKRFRSKISGPILDRFDLYVSVDKIDYERLFSHENSEGSAIVRQRVEVARENQQRKLQQFNLQINAQMRPQHIKKSVNMNAEAEDFLQTAVRRLKLSARAYHRLLRVASTLADLAGKEVIELAEVTEALNFRLQL